MKRNWIYFFIGFLVILCWFPVTQNNDFFYDDWEFINTIEAGHFDLAYLLKPHNEHFMPVFKIIFLFMFKLFGMNIVPYMWLLIFVHIANSILFFDICKRIFPRAKSLPLILAIFFLSNSAYFEVLHWFILLCTAMSLLFLQLSIIFLHRYVEKRDEKDLQISVVSSFFIPMNFSLGLIGIVILFLYYFIIIKK